MFVTPLGGWGEVGGARRPSSGCPTPRRTSSGLRDRFDLDQRAGRQRGDLDGRAGGRLVAHVPRIDLVHRLEVAEIREEHRGLHEPVEPAARLLEDRAQVREDLLGLFLDRLADEIVRARPERDLPGDEHESPGLDRLRIRRTLERRRGSLRANDRLRLHRYYFLRGLHDCASATPSDLKIASRTCCGSRPSIRRTWSVSPAPSAKASRNRAARSVASPPTRKSVRSMFETTSGRPDASSATWASASSAGTTPEP